MLPNLGLLNISFMNHVTNEEVRRKIQAAIGEYDQFLTLFKKRKAYDLAMLWDRKERIE